ncbi:hypothetical protein A3850_000410 [Lewinella sp. 4G2]|nr:hypothetical protein A3850_000410 [Lewinella sp. 4G2]
MGPDEINTTARASCDDDTGAQVAENTYFIIVDTVASMDPGPFTVTVAGVSETFDPAAMMPVFFGPFTHSGSGGATQVVTITSDNDPDLSTFVEVPEVLCGVTPDGGQASGGFCMPTTDPTEPTGAILAQSAPGSFTAGGTSGQEQVYVLVNDAGIIVQANMTGLFTGLPSDTFSVFAVNYRDTEPLPDFLIPGESFDPVLDGINEDDTDSPLDGACYTVCDTDPVIMVPVNCLSIGSTVFTDNDDDAMFDPAAGEMGIAGVDLNLFAESMPGSGVFDSLVATTTTDADGNYFFGGLDEGDYRVSIPTTPEGFPLSSTDAAEPTDATGENTDSGIQEMAGDSVVSPTISLMAQMESENDVEVGPGGDLDDDVTSFGSTSDDDANGDMTVDFGFVPTVSLGSTVFADDNDNATQDPGEMGIAGATVNLYTTSASGMVDSLVATTTTGPMGEYLFDMLLPGDYVVGVVPTDEFPVSSTGGSTDPEDGTDGDDNGAFADLMMTALMGVDAGAEVFSGVVMLMPGMEPTAADGETAPGSDQDGMDDSPADANGNMTVDFGFVPGVSIGSTVFFDNDNDGVFEASDGEDGIPGVQVFLYAADGVTVLDSTVTDSEGNYFFGGLAEGVYQVGIPESSFAAGQPLADAPASSTTTDFEGDNQSDNNDNGIQAGGAGTAVLSGPIDLMIGGEPTAAGDNGADPELGQGSELDDAMDANGDMTVDFGFFPTVSVASQVFYDVDNSGDNNGGTEEGIDGVEVLLFADVDGDNMYTPGVDTLVDMTVTMDGGLYEFDTLAPGDYIVAVVPPDTANLSSNGPAENTADDQSDNNDNGIQAMAGDTIFSSAINLAVGEEPVGEPGPGGDLDDMADEDDDGDMTIDFGLLPSVSVGSTVFQDSNGDGVRDDVADEPGIEGIIVTLLDDMGNVVAMDTTDENGEYFFDGLTPGDYELVINMVPDSLPNSSDFPAGEGDDGVDGNDNGIQDGPGQPISSGIFTLTPNEEPTDEDGASSDLDDANEDDGDLSIDFGLVPNYSLGSTIFADLDNDAMQGPDEEGVEGVEVNLYLDTDMDGMITSADSIVATTTTDMDGNYFFDNLAPGEYGVGIVPTEDLPFSSDDDADEDDANSDVDGDDNGSQPGMMAGDSIFSGVVSLGTDGMDEPTGADEGEQGGDQDDASDLEDASGNQTLDLGLFPGVSLGSTVFADVDNSGSQDADEDGIAGVAVILYSDEDGDGFTPGVDTIVAETVTDADGNYLFEMLPEGNYVVAVAPSDDFPISSTGDDEEDDANADVDGNDNGISNSMGMDPAAFDTIFSGTVELTAGGEPTAADGEDGQGSDQDGDDDSPADANGNMTVDFGFFPGLSIGSTVFFDNDNDGSYEPSDGETGIAGVQVFLYADDGVTVLDSTTTDSDGNYLFENLDAGDYIVGIPESSFAMGQPLDSAPSSSTTDEVDPNDDVDQNDNGLQPGGAGTIVQSGIVTLEIDMEPTAADGEIGEGAELDDANDSNGNMTVDFGFFPTVSIGSQVFYDVDNSGDNNGGTEEGIDGVEVLLFADVDGDNMYTPGVDTLVDMTVTMDGGLYEFDTLAPGDYIVAVVPPDTANLSSNGPGESTADDQSDNNDNGIQEMAGDTVFSAAINLTVGEEPTGEAGPGGDQDSDDDQDDDGDMTVDFGLLPSVSVGSTVFQDSNGDGVRDDVADEPGIEGIIVTLLDDMGNVVAMDTTDENGEYFFDGLTPGDYELVINMVPDSLPNSSDFPAGEGDDGVDGNDNGIQDGPGQPISSGIFTLTPNEEPTDEDGSSSDLDDANEDDGDLSIDFGLVPNYSLGSTIFADLDNDAMQGPDEEGVAGVEVNLYLDSDMDGMITSADSIVATTTTDADGNYFFDNLQPGEYGVGIVPTDDLPFSSDDDADEDDANSDVDGDDNGSQPGMMAGDSIFSGVLSLGTDGMDEPIEDAEDGQGGDQDDASALEDASGNQTLDLGLFPGVSLGSTVFADVDNSGTQDDDEDGIAGVAVILYSDEDGDGFTPGVDTIVAETTTDADGNYLFEMLPEGNYVVAVAPSDDFPISSTGDGEEDDANADVDGNDNGISNSMGMDPAAFDTIFSGTVELTAGDEPTAADGEDGEGSDQDGDDDSPEDANGNMTVDFGFFPGLSIGSTVFFDNDNDGLYEPSDAETGIAGVQVFLYADDGVTVLDSTVTDGDGNYLFENLDAGDYIVGIPESSFAPGQPLDSAPSSSTTDEEDPNDDVDQNDNGLQPGGAGTIVQSGIVTLEIDMEPTFADGEIGEGADQDDANDANGNMTVDFGFFPTVSIGSQVFLDIDNSGDDNGGTEEGIDDVEVLLFADVDGDNMYTPGVDTLVAMTTTMDGGLYEFDTLAPGDYIVAVIPPLDNNLSSNGAGESTEDDQVDGNDNGIQEMAGDTVFSAAINLTVGDEPEGESGPGGDQDDDDDQDDDGDMTVDFGLLPSVSVGSTVFQDSDNSGVQDAGEPGVEGIVVTLLDDMGNVVAMDTTDENGDYFFDGLTPGDYQIAVNMVPDSLPNSSTMDNVGGVEGTDLNDNGLQPDGPGTPILSEVFTLEPNNMIVEAGDTGGMQDDDNDDDGDMTIDIGLVPNYSLGSTIFADLDNSGTQDDGEEGVEGVEVTLYVDSDMDGMITSADSVVATTTTDADGNYFFDNLLPGEYGVGIVPTEDLPFSSNDDDDEDDANSDVDGDDNGSQPGMMAGDSIFSGVLSLGTDGMDEPTGDDEDGQGGDQDDASDLEDASGNQTLDLGLFPGVSLGSTVFADLDNDGRQGDDEDGIAGLPVLLYEDVDMDGVYDPAVDTLVAETTTDADGNYFFDMLPEGDYFVGVVPSPEFPVSSMEGEETDPDDDGDNNDNGIQNTAGMTPMSGDTILSGAITLSGGDEPEGDDEDAQGGDQDDDNDSSGNMTVDFAFNPGVSIGSTVFYDLDNDGMFETTDGENGIEGVQVFLYADDGVTVLDSTLTDENGNYFFGGLDEGDYIVGIPESAFAVGNPLESAPNSSTPTDGEADDRVDNNDNGAQPGGAGTIVQSGIINLMIGEEPTFADGETGQGGQQDDAADANGDMTVDFGFFPTMSIGSQVFLDIDNSGDNNGGTEAGIDGVEVLLFADVDGDNMYTPGVDTLVDMTVTMDGGLYEFDTLVPGDYIVAVVPPVDNDLSSNGPGENTADDQSDNNDNGIQAMAGDTVFSTAINLTVGEEPTGEPGPGGELDDDDDQDDDGDMTIDFGLLPSVSVGSSVFQDTNGDGEQGDVGDEPGVEGIIVTLLDDEGNVVAMDTTDENGAYFFDGLTPGDYELVINMVPDSLPNSSDFPAGEGDDGVDGNDNGIQDGPGQPISSGIFTLTPNMEPTDEMGTNSDLDDENDDDGDVSIDFGLVPNYSLGSTIFADLDNSGTQDDNEEGVEGVEVTLYIDSDMDGMITSADSVVATTTTDADGNYFFDNLFPGEYGVGIVPTDDLPFSSDDDNDSDDANDDVDGDDNGSQPGMMAGDSIFSGVVSLGTDGMDEPMGDDEDGQGGDQDDASDLEDASGNQTLDLGLFPGVSLGSTVFADLDNDGMQGDDEDGIAGLPVLLYEDVDMDGVYDPAVDTLVAETTTDADGNYFFDMLPEGDYFVGVVPSPEFPVSSMEGEETDPDDDGDNNDNGIQNTAGMTPMSGDTILSGAITLSGGDEPEGDDEGAQGGDQDDDNDSSGNMTVDFAFNPGVSIGSTVFYDLDNDGMFETTDGENGIEGVQVFLYADDGVTVLDSTLTDENGNYFFGGLDEGDYIVGIPESAFAVGNPLESAPNSSTVTDGEADDQVDNNDNGAQPGGAGTIVQSGIINLMIGEEPTFADGETGQGGQQDDAADANGDMTVDFGFFPTMSIGSQVFLDIDNSGDNNGGTEAGIDGVEVLLFADVDGDNMYTPGVDTLVDMTVTMDGGLYEFDTLVPGDYIVAVVPPVDNDLSSNGPGENTADDQSDNNDNGIQAMAGDTVFSTAINLTVGEEPTGEPGPGGELDDDDDQDDDGDMTIDFGLLPSVSVGSSVFQDTDGDGVQGDPGDEPGVEGIIVTLLDDEGNVVAMDTTDENGAYFFDGLTPGDYELVINMVPDSLPNSSDFPAGEGDDGVDGNDNGIQDGPGQPISSGIFTLTPNMEPTDEMGTNSDLDDENDDDGDVSIDFGLVPNYSLGSTIFADLDNNAMQDDDEVGIPGVVVNLYVDSDMDGIITSADSIIATTTTDADGNYFFENLFPGDYGVSVVPTGDFPLSSDDDVDSDDANDDVDGDDNGFQAMSGDTIFSSVVTLGDGEPTGDDEGGQGGDQDDDSDLEDASGNMTLDFGLFPGMSVGSTVFADTNNDGINGPDESGLSGILVVLYDNETMMAIDSVLTDDDGNYIFTGLPEGDYYIEIPGDQLVGGNGLFDMDASSSTPDNDADADIDNNDDGSQVGGPGTTITSGVFTLSAGDEPVNGIGGEQNGGSTLDDAFDPFGNMTVDFGLFIPMFDLALIKELAPGQSPNVNPGDTVAFQITVLNQGNLAADSIVVSDYVPTQTDGFTFDPTLNPDWTVESTINDTTRLQTVLTEFDGADTLAMGASTTVDIFLVVNPAMEAVMPLTNLAEISDATGPNGEDVVDIDSPMDTIPGNDNFFEDNEIDGNGLAGGDEDNSDPATVLVGGFDLALVKTLSAGQSSTVSPGDEVSFDITTINQGAIIADNIELVDYVPAGFLFDPALNPGWMLNADGNPTTTLSVADGTLAEDGLEPGESTTTQIILTVAPPMFPDYVDGTGMNPDGVESGQPLVNEAEIAGATDENGDEVTDIDSNSDSTQGNDGEADDDEVNGGGDTNGDGTVDDDEDDNDIAIVTVECYQDPGVDNEIQVCLGCDEAVVTINLFESLGGLPNIGGVFAEGSLIFMDEDGNPIAVDLSDPENVVIPGTLDRSRDYSVTYTIPAVNDCPEETATITIDIFDIQNLSCTGFQNISLGEDCNAEITPELILQGNLFCASSLEVVLMTTDGDTLRDENGLPTAFVGNDEVNETLLVSLVDPMCDNSCWGQILVEDKKRPTIECPADIAGLNGVDFICTDIDSILNLESSFAFTGAPVIDDNCTPTDELELEFYDLLLPNDDPMCTPSTILRTFTVTDESGNSATCVQEITVRPATLADVTIPTENFFSVECSDNLETLPSGNPLPSATPQPFVTTALGTYPLNASSTYCSLASQFSDSQAIPKCENAFEFTRTYTLFDWCEPTNAPVTFTQIITVEDRTAPEFTSTQENFEFEVNTSECAAIFRLDDPGIRLIDNCSSTITASAVIYPNGDTLGAPIGTFFLDFFNGEQELSTEIPLGDHIIRYTYADGCGNEASTDVPFSVVDRTGPSIICEDGINVGLSMDGPNGVGTASLTPDIILSEATDACGEIVSITIGRVGADGDLEAVDYSEEVLLGCADVGTLTVAIRVEDESGNVNYCDSEILVEMKAGAAPTCIAPSAVTMTCEEFSGMIFSDIMESTQEERDNAFGTATAVGMCQTEVTDEITVSNLNECGVGSFVRSFTVTQTVGDQTSVSTTICTQVVTVVGTYDYQFVLPGDATVSCTDEIDVDSLEVAVGGGCDLVTITETVEMVENTPGDECRQMRITYDVINTCEYDPALGGVTVLSRDGNGVRTSAEDVLYFNVVANSAQMTTDDVAFYSSTDDRFFQNEATTVDSELVGYANSNSRGRFQYTQIINIIDRNSPVLTVTAPTECVAAGGGSCLADVELEFSATDECSDLAVTYELDANYVAASGFEADDASALGIVITDVADEDGNVSFSAFDVPAGNHALRITATDDCGNATTSLVEFCVSSDLVPAPLCLQTLVAPLGMTTDGDALAQVWASDFVTSPVIACNGEEITSYSIYTDEEANNGVAVEEGRTGIDVTCADEGFVPVRVYAFSNGNASSFCQAMIEVQDPDGICPDGTVANISGIIVTEQMSPVENAEVDLSGPSDMSMTMTTAADGAFMFSEVPMGADYTVTPTHFTDYLNGVRTSDIVAITRHILGVDMLDSPYKLIAADVDGTAEINIGDVISIRRLILGLSDTYPNGMPSWSFVPADYEFGNLNDPWATAFPELINTNDLAANIVDADFVGVKLGDVNGSARANSLMQAAQRNVRGSLELEMRELDLKQGQTYRIPVTAPKLTEVDGYQFTLEFDRTAVEIEGIEPGLVAAGNFGWRFADQGIITTSWNWATEEVPSNWTADEVLFTLIVKAEANVSISDAIEAGSRYTEAEAYERGGNGLRNLDLIFNEDVVEVAGYALLQNIPNPVNQETTIGFELPQAHDKVTISITDAAGRLVREFTQEGYVGYNSLKVTKRQLGQTSGVYSYTVSAGDWIATKRMIVIE